MTIQKVVPVKQESSATGGNPADDFEFLNNPANPNEDALEVRGLYVQNDTLRDTQVLLSRDASNNMTFVDGVTGPWTLTDLLASGGITEAQHEALNTINHWLTHTSYDQVTYTGNLITNITTWDSSSMTLKQREVQLTYTGNKITQGIEIQYDGTGTETYRVVEAYAYTGNKLTSCTRTRI